MRFQSYFNTAVQLISQYNGELPLVYFLKQYFAQHKKHGSKDRKFIAHLCYCYYRLGYALQEMPVEERLKTALFLCNKSAGGWNILYDAAWLNGWMDDLSTRLAFVHSVNPFFTVRDIFPWTDELSDGIDIPAFVTAQLVQPDLFLRIRPANEKVVLQKLADHQVVWKALSATCLALPNATKIESVLEIDREAVIQDYSSQRIAEFLPLARQNLPTAIWDCCAASGGKSILVYDMMPDIELTVSDIRPSIIQNLKQRFQKAGIKNYIALVHDNAISKFKIQNSKFNIILCDVPCSGSGTWGRTPEQLCFFSKEKISEYSALQKKIITNVVAGLAEDGYLLYITCSVFKKENEEMVNFIKEKFQFHVIKMELLKGYDKKADTMFAVLFQRVRQNEKR